MPAIAACALRFQILVLTLYPLICCGCVQKQMDHSFEQRLENGVPVAVTSGGPMYNEPPFRLEYILSVEQSEQTPATLLKAPYDFAPGPDSTLIVVERDEGRAVVYDLDGRFIREIGGKGAGPGQFETMRNLSVVGDSLFFYDRSLLRITSLGVDGSLLSVSSVKDYGVPLAIDYLPDGFLAISDISFRFEKNLAYQSLQLSIIHFATGDTAANVTTGYVIYGDPLVSQGRVGGASARPFVGKPVARTISNQILLLSPGDQPVIDLFDIRGQLLKSIRIGIQPRPVTQRLRNAYWSGVDERQAQFGRTLDPSYKAQQIFPKHAGWWRSVIADDAGYLWLEDAVSNPARLWFRPCSFFVIDPDGRYLGDVELPSWNGRIQAGLCYALVRNLETDAVEPTIYRIVSNQAGLEYLPFDNIPSDHIE